MMSPEDHKAVRAYVTNWFKTFGQTIREEYGPQLIAPMKAKLATAEDRLAKAEARLKQLEARPQATAPTADVERLEAQVRFLFAKYNALLSPSSGTMRIYRNDGTAQSITRTVTEEAWHE